MPIVDRQMFVTVLTSILLLLFISVANSASFDCAKAASQTEKFICGDAELSRQDSTLGEKYRQLEKSEKLKKAQRQWVNVRNKCADIQCLKTSYQIRIAELESHYLKQQYAGQSQKVTTIKEENWNNGAAAVVRIKVPVDADSNWRQFLTIKLGDKVQNSSDWVLDSNGLAMIYPFIEPNQSYKVEVKPGLKAVNGTSLARPGEESFTSRQTQPSVNFSGDGYVLSNKIRRALPVTTLNIDEVDIEIFRILPEHIGKWIHYSYQDRNSYYQLNHFANETKMVYSGRFPVKHQRNQRTTTNLDLSKIASLDQQGAYVAVLSAPGLYKNQYPTNFFTISDIGLQLRKNERILRINANSISTGNVLENVLLSIYRGEKLIGQQSTNELGEAQFESFYSQGNTLVAQKGQEYTVIDFKRSPLDLSAFKNPVSRHQPMQVFAWGPRNLYRPGETLDIFALLKDFDGQKTAK
ncbi:lysozyme inhibitor LprI family protein [Psychromonas aquimarina]|uniref:lysozyme inhibitor LprI family protein n=1 Tax=Psychromonas aquimarina TaxID=444919 RepID=UPI000427A1CF|nr:lysozyme inhibitor LprI family protein [Psychromonas aquimarina]